MTATTQTLVLDVGYQPIHRTSVRRAVNLLLKGKAELVEAHALTLWTRHARPEETRTRTATEEFRAPSVIRLVHLAVVRRKQPRFNRVNIWRRDKGRCQYCGKPCPLDGEGKFTFDHVVPVAQGGTRRWENIVVACMPCNQKKGGRTPAQAGLELRQAPIRPRELPGRGAELEHVWAKGMPPSWRQWMRDALYWNDELQA